MFVLSGLLDLLEENWEEDARLKWALEDGEMGMKINRRAGAAFGGRGRETRSCGEQRGVR